MGVSILFESLEYDSVFYDQSFDVNLTHIFQADDGSNFLSAAKYLASKAKSTNEKADALNINPFPSFVEVYRDNEDSKETELLIIDIQADMELSLISKNIHGVFEKIFE